MPLNIYKEILSPEGIGVRVLISSDGNKTFEIICEDDGFWHRIDHISVEFAPILISLLEQI